jgi:hypothetical protein
LRKSHSRLFTCTAGDIFELRKSSTQPAAETKVNADYVCRAFHLLQYDAIGLGEKDLSFGPDYLKAQAEALSLPFVSTNVYDKASGKSLFDPWIVVEREGLRVAFLSVISPERHLVAQVESELLEFGMEIRDPTTAVQEVLPEVRQQADVVVLLSHTGIETSKFLAEDLDVDVVIVGHFPAVQNDPEKVGGAVYAMAGGQTDRFGTLELTLSADRSEIVAFDGDAIRVLKEGPTHGELAALELEWDQAVQSARRETQLAAQRARESEVRDKVASDIHARGGIFGAESCKTCHQDTYDSWMATPHATAFARLAEADAWDNPDCIGCHVTGVAEKHYVADVNVNPEVWNVQCEECHGSGLQHARDGTYVTQGEATCRKCHDPENSPEFDFDIYSSYGVH